MQLLSDRGVFDNGFKFRSMILPDIFIDQDTPEKMYEKVGLNSLSIVSKIEETLNSNIILAKNKTSKQINYTELCSLKSDQAKQLIIASPIGTALIPTQGSCRPLTEILVFLPFGLLSFDLLKSKVGLTANEATIF